MERRFAIMGHRATSSGKLNLNDLAGACGRMDVLVRAVNTCLFSSHGIRDDSSIILHLMGGPGPVRRICFDGSCLKGVHPDERSIAGHISRILQEPVPAIGQQMEIGHGIWHSGGGLEQTISEWEREDIRMICLDADADTLTFSKEEVGGKVGFFLSDDQPFTENEHRQLSVVCEKNSLGKVWMQGHACIAIVQYLIDQN